MRCWADTAESHGSASAARLAAYFIDHSCRAANTRLMVSWGDFAAARPDLAQAARELLYQHGVGLAFLATVRRDGGPRLHPMCPLLAGPGMYAFIIPSPKQEDLLRDGRYAMHSLPADPDEGARRPGATTSGLVTPLTRLNPQH